MIASLLSAAAPESVWLPPAASAASAGVDRMFAFIFWTCTFFFALIVGLATLFVVKYRARQSVEPQKTPTHNTRLELVWSGIPLVLALIMFAKSTEAYRGLTELAPGGQVDAIQVTARKWSWWFDHPGGHGANELHVVVGHPVEVTLASEDVIHSLYIPAFRIKQDAVPGRYTKLAFTPIAPGTYPIYCAEYCGTNHSQMRSQVVVHRDRASYDAWIKQVEDASVPLVDVGRTVYLTKGCIACHTVDGTPRLAPTFKASWGRVEKLVDGSSVTVDEAYVRESLLNPRAKLVAGFQPVMPPMPLKEREMLGLFEYLKSLK